MTVPAASSDQTINVSHQGSTIPFTFPDSGNMREHVLSILSGREYPIVPLDGYSPDVILDIGANTGCSGLFFHLLYPSARLLCYEPSATSFEYLGRNLAGRATVELFPYGLSDRTEAIQLYVGREQSMQNSMLRSIETSDATECAQVRRASEEWRDRGLSHASIIKLDTEGCEVPILEDLRSILPSIDFLYVEYHSEADRRTIDALMHESCVLAYCLAQAPHRGTILYISRRLFERYPVLDRMKISRP